MDLIEDKISQTENRHPWELSRYEVFKDIISPYFDLKSKKTIVDIGCGDVFFIGSLSSEFSNLNCIGVDINFTNDYIKSFTDKYEKVRLYKTIEDAIVNETHIDLVLLMDVIEHIEDDESFISKDLSPLLKKFNPLVLVTVPAFQTLFSNHDLLLQHYRRYTYDKLKLLLTRNDLKIIKGLQQ